MVTQSTKQLHGFCCMKLKVLANYHDFMDVSTDNGRISVYAGQKNETFWDRHINKEYFEFDYCPFCGSILTP